MASPFQGTVVFVDTETESTRSLSRDGLWAYAAESRITTSAIAVGDGEVRSLDERQLLATLDEMRGRGVPFRLTAHNVQFDRAIIEFAARRHGFTRKGPGFLPAGVWCCTQVMARSLNLPASLEDLAAFLWPDEEGKDMEGHALVAGDGDDRPSLFDDPDRMERVAAYCRQDTALTRRVYQALLPHVSDLDLELAGPDSSVNLRGLPVDVGLCKRMAEACEAERLELHEWARAKWPSTFTGRWSLGQVDKVKGLVAVLREEGDDKVADELQAKRDRYGMVVSALSKWEAGAKSVDGRARCCFVACATQSNRWAGRRVQPQNLKRVSGDPLLDTRAMVKAGKGKVIVEADFSQIELRLALFLSGQRDDLAAVAEGGDLYLDYAGRVFGKGEAKTHRHLLKTALLALQYGIGRQSALDRLVEQGASADQAGRVWDGLERTLLKGYRAGWDNLRDLFGRRVGRFAKESSVHSWAVLPGWRRKVVWQGVNNARDHYDHMTDKGHTVRERWYPAKGWAHVVSGLAASIATAALVAVERRLASEGLAARLVGSVHDSLLVESPDGEVDAVRRVLTEEMEGVFEACPMKAVVKSGPTWAEAK